MVYNIALLSAGQRSEPVMSIHISHPVWTSLPPTPHPTRFTCEGSGCAEVHSPAVRSFWKSHHIPAEKFSLLFNNSPFKLTHSLKVSLFPVKKNSKSKFKNIFMKSGCCNSSSPTPAAFDVAYSLSCGATRVQPAAAKCPQNTRVVSPVNTVDRLLSLS